MLCSPQQPVRSEPEPSTRQDSADPGELPIIAAILDHPTATEAQPAEARPPTPPAQPSAQSSMDRQREMARKREQERRRREAVSVDSVFGHVCSGDVLGEMSMSSLLRLLGVFT